MQLAPIGLSSRTRRSSSSLRLLPLILDLVRLSQRSLEDLLFYRSERRREAVIELRLLL